MFILLVGLLGVASLIPVGKFEMQRGAKVDRAAACGRAAMREVKARGILNPLSWARYDGAQVSFPAGFSIDGGSTPRMPCVVIDPLGVGDASGTATLGQSFPWPGSASTAPTVPHLPRLTLGPGTGLSTAARAALADAIFRSQDDLAFDVPTDETLLPTQILQGDARRLSQGDYSWLVTVVPDPNLYDANNPAAQPMRVSIVVFYKRPLGAIGAGERICDIPTATGAGEIVLNIGSESAATFSAEPYNNDAAKFLDVKPGQWLMVAGTPDTTASQPRWHYSWQRIVATDDVQGTSRAVTLTGADQTFFGPPNYSKGANKAFLFDGVIAVYEKMLKLEVDSMY